MDTIPPRRFRAGAEHRAVAGGGWGYGQYGVAGFSPLAIILIILVILLLTGNLNL